MGFVLLLIVCLGTPFYGLYLCMKHNKKAYIPFAIGMVVYSIAQVCFRIPIFSFLNTRENFFTWASSNALVYIIILSVSAAMVEELGRWLGYRIIKNCSLYNAVALGLGHGLMEALYIAVIPYVSYGLDVSMQVYIVVSVERFLSIIVQTSLALFIWKAYKETSFYYFLIAMLLHVIYILVPSILTILMPTSALTGTLILTFLAGAIAWYSYTLIWKQER